MWLLLWNDDPQAQMVQYGGFVGDADTNVSERQALESTSRGGNTVAFHSLRFVFLILTFWKREWLRSSQIPLQQ